MLDNNWATIGIVIAVLLDPVFFSPNKKPLSASGLSIKNQIVTQSSTFLKKKAVSKTLIYWLGDQLATSNIPTQYISCPSTLSLPAIEFIYSKKQKVRISSNIVESTSRK